MADKLTTLKTVLSSISGSPLVYALEKPANKNDNCIVYNLISENPIHSLDKTKLASKDRVQVDAWGTTFKKAKDLGEKVKTALDVNDSDFMCSYMIDGKLTKELDTGIFRYILDFYIY